MSPIRIRFLHAGSIVHDVKGAQWVHTGITTTLAGRARGATTHHFVNSETGQTVKAIDFRRIVEKFPDAEG